jgi:hypothetical protein
MTLLDQLAIKDEAIPPSQSLICVLEKGKLVWKNSCKSGCRGNKGLQLEGIQPGYKTIPASYSLSCRTCGGTFSYFGNQVPKEVRMKFNEY